MTHIKKQKHKMKYLHKVSAIHIIINIRMFTMIYSKKLALLK